jgi:hypothetical protein
MRFPARPDTIFLVGPGSDGYGAGHADDCSRMHRTAAQSQKQFQPTAP